MVRGSKRKKQTWRGTSERRTPKRTPSLRKISWRLPCRGTKKRKKGGSDGKGLANNCGIPATTPNITAGKGASTSTRSSMKNKSSKLLTKSVSHKEENRNQRKCWNENLGDPEERKPCAPPLFQTTETGGKKNGNRRKKKAMATEKPTKCPWYQRKDVWKGLGLFKSALVQKG